MSIKNKDLAIQLVLFIILIFSLTITSVTNFQVVESIPHYPANDISPSISSGGWNAQVTKDVGNGPQSVYIGDANNDGQNDIVSVRYLSLLSRHSLRCSCVGS